MKLHLFCVGKLRGAAERALCEEYLARLQRYGPVALTETSAAKSAEPAKGRTEECNALLKSMDAAKLSRVWILEERGKQVTSKGLAEKVVGLENQSTKSLGLVLGGAYGLDERVKARGELWALASLTFPHELCRVVLLEQLYRARTIQRGEPYHH